MMMKFFSGLAILTFALFLQSVLASVGLAAGNLPLAVLIAFVFVFEFEEVLVFSLIAVLFLNWKPTLGIEMVMLIILPLIFSGLRKYIQWELWLGGLVSITLGLCVFAVIASPSIALSNIPQLLREIIVGLIAGEIIILSLKEY
jgi:hypothetical protein